MKVAQALMFAVLALQASAIRDSQTKTSDATKHGGKGDKGGDNTQTVTGSGGGKGPTSVSSSLQCIPPSTLQLCLRV